jgi:hypothetical protein
MYGEHSMNSIVDQKAKLASLLERYNQKDCLLFVGAGFSHSARRAQYEGQDPNLPIGGALAESLADALNEEDKSDLGDLSGQYQEKFGEHGLLKLLTGLYTSDSATDEQKEICRYKWKEIYTTNYDNVLELCHTQNGTQYTRYGYTNVPSDLDYKKTPIIHINGYIDGVDIKIFSKEIRISNTHYCSDDFSRSPWGERFRSDLSTARCIVFVGYSLYDLDVSRVLKSNNAIKDRTFFIVEPNAKPATVRKLADFGIVLQIGIDGFSEIIRTIPQDKQKNDSVDFVAWTSVELIKNTSAKLLDRDVMNFVIAGITINELFEFDTISDSNKYYIKRNAVSDVISLIEERKSKYFILTGKIGNGKTICLKAISTILAAKGYKVLEASASEEMLIREVSNFSKLEGPIVAIIDDLVDRNKVASALKNLNRDDLFIVASARTFQFEFQQADINRTFNEQITRFSLDKLSANESRDLVDFLQLYGFWGSKHTLSHDEKLKFVQNECSADFRTVLLDVMNAPHIRTKIEAIIGVSGNSKAQEELRSILILSQLLRLGNLEYNFRRIDEILELNTTQIVNTHRENLSDVSYLDQNRILISSSILSEYLLKNLIESAFVIDILLSAMNRLDKIYNNDVFYKESHKTFCRFSFIESAIAVERRRQHLVSYFEGIKHLNYCKDEPLFWLQYAMARMSLEQYPESKTYFEIAYSISKKMKYRENRHLDNQFARFLLESRTKSNAYEDFMQAFNSAHSICIKQMKSELDSPNPYRAASNYRAFVERRLEQFEQGDLIAIFRSCVEVQRQINQADNSIRSSISVASCATAMAATIKIVRDKLKTMGVAI